MIEKSILLSQQAAPSNLSGASSQKKLNEAIEEFEAIFLSYVIKVMRESTPKSELFGGGLGEEQYMGLMEQELARSLSRHGGLGLAKPLQETLAHRAEGDKRPSLAPRVDARTPRPVVGDARFVHPVNGALSSDFGWRTHPLTGRTQFHKGVDLAAPEGKAVAAAGDGRVVFSGSQEGFGNMVVIEHPNGYRTRYAHLQVAEVSVGDPITAGQKIGAVGQTGRATGPHLHFEIWKGGSVIDPKKVL
jgi:murein DD-endopeptidase MepM/ murein hydrolase activator NlpD